MNQFQTGCLLFLTLMAATISLMAMKSVLIPFVLSIFCYMVSLPPLQWLEFKFCLPRWLAVVVMSLFFFLLGVLFFFLISQSIEVFLQEQDFYKQRISVILSDVELRLKQWNVNLAFSEIQSMVSQDYVLTFVRKLSGGFLGILGNLSLIFIFLIFLVSGANSRKTRNPIILKIQKNISLYISIKIFISLLTGFLIGLVLFLFGVKMALMFGFLTFLLNFIPTIGSLFAVMLPLPFIWLHSGFSYVFYGVFLFSFLIQMVLGSFLEPKMLGKSMGIHPIVALLSLLFWGVVLGIVGVFLAIPLTVSFKIIMEHLEPTKKLAQALEGNL